MNFKEQIETRLATLRRELEHNIGKKVALESTLNELNRSIIFTQGQIQSYMNILQTFSFKQKNEKKKSGGKTS